MGARFGTLVGMVKNSNWTYFGVCRINSIVPPPVQKCNFEMVITFEPFVLEKKVLCSLIVLSLSRSHSISYIKIAHFEKYNIPFFFSLLL